MTPQKPDLYRDYSRDAGEPLDDSSSAVARAQAARFGSDALLRAQLMAGQHYLSNDAFHAALARLNPSRSNDQ